MKTITHKMTIETELVCSEDGKHTYEVVKRFPDIVGEKAYIILLYPTRTRNNMYSDDSTLNHLVSHMNELGLNELRIINLFSIVVSKKMSSRGLQVDENNLKYIEDIMQNKSFADFKFIVAWGTSMASSYACQQSKAEVFNMFKKYSPKDKLYQFGTNNDNITVDFAHPLFLGIRAKSSIWKLEEVKIKKNMLNLPEQKLKHISVKEKELDF